MTRTNHVAGLILPVILSLFFLVACTNAEKPLTAGQVLDFGRKIETSIASKEGKFMDEAFDRDELFKRTKIPAKNDKGATKNELDQTMKMGTAIINALSEKGSYEMLRQYEKDNVHHLVFRMHDQGKINYHDMELKSVGGKCKIVDMFIYLGGDYLSSTIHSVYQFIPETTDQSTSTGTTDWQGKAADIRTLINNGQSKEAKEIYDGLPDAIKVSRPLQVMHLQICSGLGSEEYDAALKEFEKNFPNQSHIELLMVDGYMARHEFDKAIAAIDKLDKDVGHDPLLDFHRAICYMQGVDAAKGRECLERLVKNKPNFEPGYLELIKGYLLIGEYEKAKPLVDLFKTKKEFDQADLNTLIYRYPGYISKFETN